MQGDPVEWYKRQSRRSLELLGVDESIQRKVLAAVGIQFGVSVGQAVVAVTVDGLPQLVLAVALLAGAGVAFANTVFITREDFVEPVTTLAESADRIADGEIGVFVPENGQSDEVGALVHSFAAMREVSDATGDQAETTQEVVAMVDEVDEVSERTSDEAERVAAAAQQQTATVAEVTEEVGAVAERSDELTSLLDRFEVDSPALEASIES